MELVNFFSSTPYCIIRLERVANIIDDVAMVHINEGAAVCCNNTIIAGRIICGIITDDTVHYLQFSIT